MLPQFWDALPICRASRVLLASVLGATTEANTEDFLFRADTAVSRVGVSSVTEFAINGIEASGNVTILVPKSLSDPWSATSTCLRRLHLDRDAARLGAFHSHFVFRGMHNSIESLRDA